MEKNTLVICIMNHDTSAGQHKFLADNGYNFPIKGNYYVVRGDNGLCGIFLEEIINPSLNCLSVEENKFYKGEVAFGYWAFEIVQEPMEISISNLIEVKTC